MGTYSQHVNKKQTAQTEQARAEQVQNNAGGFVFQISKWQRLDRFLILGNENGTYYVGEKKLTKENAACVEACLKEDGLRTINRIVEISDKGLAPKNDPAIFALALAASCDDLQVRQTALGALPAVCRIGTHLFHFLQDISTQKGWPRSLRRSVAKWYTEKTAEKLAYDVAKYQQRDGWSHRDVLRLSHAKGPSPQHQAIFRWIVTRNFEARKVTSKLHADRSYPALERNNLPALLQAFEEVHKTTDMKRVVQLIQEHRLSHEMVPNEWKNDSSVWEAMLPHMGLTALIRNLGKLTAVGALAPFKCSSIEDRLTNREELRKARIHPMAILLALSVYKTGHGQKGKLSWNPVASVVGALDQAFYECFQNVEPTGKNILIGLDVSGSMAGSAIAGSSLSAREASAAMVMMTVKTEKNVYVHGFSHRFMELPGMHRAASLDAVVRDISNLPFESTDCALPMVYATQSKLPVDTFVVYTDNETYAGGIHPFQALKQYRQKMGRPAKLIVNGMTATDFSIADPSDSGMLDVVGMDASAPQVMADFSRAPLGGDV